MILQRAFEPPSPAACRAQPLRRRLRDAPPPVLVGSDGRGAQRAPSRGARHDAGDGGERVAYHSRELRDGAALGATASPIPRAAAAPDASTEFGGGRKRAGRRPSTGRWGQPNQVYGQPYRGFEFLPLRKFFVNVLASSNRPAQRAAHRLPKVEQVDGFAERARRQVHVPERHGERAVADQLLNRLRRRAPHREV